MNLLFWHCRFTPDFTMSRIRRVLVIHTSLGSHINYTLQATLPSSMLTKCAAALPRPWWEFHLYWISVVVMAIMGCGVFLSAYIDSDRLYANDIVQLRMQMQYDRNKVFDLVRLSGSGSGSTTSVNGKDNSGGNSPVANGHALSGGIPKPSVLLKTDPCAPICNGNGHAVHAESTKAKTVHRKREIPGIGFLRSLYQRFVGNQKTTSRRNRPETPERQISSEDDGYMKATPEPEQEEQPILTKPNQPTSNQSQQLYNRQKKPKGVKRQLVPINETTTTNPASKKGGRKTSMEKMDKNSNTLNTECVEPSLSAVKAQLDQAQSTEIPADNAALARGNCRSIHAKPCCRVVR